MTIAVGPLFAAESVPFPQCSYTDHLAMPVPGASDAEREASGAPAAPVQMIAAAPAAAAAPLSTNGTADAATAVAAAAAAAAAAELAAVKIQLVSRPIHYKDAGNNLARCLQDASSVCIAKRHHNIAFFPSVRE